MSWMSSGSMRATKQPRRGEISTRPSFLSSRSAERSVVRLTPNSSASLASSSRVPSGSSLLMIWRRRVRRTASGSDRWRIGSACPVPLGVERSELSTGDLQQACLGEPRMALALLLEREVIRGTGEKHGEPRAVPGERAAAVDGEPDAEPPASVPRVEAGVEIGDGDQIAEREFRARRRVGGAGQRELHAPARGGAADSVADVPARPDAAHRDRQRLAVDGDAERVEQAGRGVERGDSGDRLRCPLAAGSHGDRVSGPQPRQIIGREHDDHPLPFPALTQDRAAGPGPRTGPHLDGVADARQGGERVSGGEVAVHQARARSGMIGLQNLRRVAEAQAEHDPAVADRYVGVTVAADPVGLGSDLALVDGAEKIDRHERAHAIAAESSSPSGARLASGSTTVWKASRGPLMIVEGPGPCPNSWQLPVEMTPMVIQPGRYPR